MTASKTSSVRTKAGEEIPSSLVAAVCERLAEGNAVRRTLPGGGRLHVDRPLPFLCVYRQPPNHADVGTERLVKGEPAYVVIPGDAAFRATVSNLVRAVVRTLSAQFGAFLLVELWSPAAEEPAGVDTPATRGFVIHTPETAALESTAETLAKWLRRVKVLKRGVGVDVVRDGQGYPASMPPLLTTADAREFKCSFIGLSVPPVYRKANTGKEFPQLALSLRHSLSLALRQTYYEFVRSRTTHRPPHFHALGRRAVVKAVWDIDEQLTGVSQQFDYLLQLTPVNARAAWRRFQHGRFEREPEFRYRPLPVDPAALKRQLYKIPIERVEDPALQRLFQAKQEELELKITMLRDRDTPRFLYESLQLFGGASDDLLAVSVGLLEQLAARGRLERGPKLNADAFAAAARTEMELYRRSCPTFTASARVTSDVSGLIVSRGNLLIASDLRVPVSRVQALLAHEVGTHLVTYYNGRMQPFRQLYSGLPGYEELQEGLAVLSEYLVAGLSRRRMRQLAGRVVAVRCLTEGASFVETFRVLERVHGFNQRAAYNISMRVYRGGGLTKDVVYLRGLEAILRYVQRGGDLTPLWVGKIAAEHVPIIEELHHRKVLKPVTLFPLYMRDKAALARLELLRGGERSLVDLVSEARNGSLS